MTAATRSAGAVTGLLVCLGLGLFGQAGWLAALVLGIVAGLLMAGLLGWMIDGGPRAMHASDWAPPPVPLEMPVPEAHLAEAGPAETGADDTEAETGAQPAAAAEAPRAQAASTEPVAVPDAAPDDLRAIRGVGAKVEQALIAAGVTRYAQIAAWDDAQIDRMAARIGRGAARIRNDDWVGQAAALAGPETGATAGATAGTGAGAGEAR